MRLRVFGDGKRQPGPVGQGTVVGSPVVGTIDGPKQAPTATQFGGHEEIPTTQHTVSQLRGWPVDDVIDSRSAAAGRSNVIPTDYELQTQPGPDRIDRQLQARNVGFIGDGPISGFPYDAAWGYIPHQFVPRAPRGAGPAVRMMDDTAPIQAVYAGNPRVSSR